MAGTVAISACASEAETPTTPAPPPTASTTSAPATSAPQTPASSALSSTTTETAGSTTPEPAPSEIPAIVAAEGILGWWDGEWISPSSLPPLTGGEAYRVVSLDGVVDTVVGSAPEPVGDPCPDELFHLDLDPSPWPGYDPFSPDALAVAGGWDPAPRPVEQLSTESDVYETAVASLLSHRGVDDPEPELVQVLRTDLEGDGVDEVFVVAENIEGDFFVGPGSYSLAIARKVIHGEVQTAILGSSVVADGSTEEFPLLVSHRISAVADLNGDGDLEVALGWAYYEGAGTGVYDYINDDLGFVEVLAVGCGA